MRKRSTDTPSHLFTLRFRLASGPVTIYAWENYAASLGQTHTHIDVELRQGGRVVFPRGKTWCGVPGHTTTDGIYARELVGSLLAMRPGDTDRDYFDGYTAEQLAWAEANGEELEMLVSMRYCDPETGAVRSGRR